MQDKFQPLFQISRTGLSISDEKTVRELAQKLDGLPLALEQAAAYITETGLSFEQYAILLDTRQQELLGRGQSSQDYPFTVATTWELSFQKVQEKAPAGADLLNLCTFFAPANIPYKRLIELANIFSTGLRDLAQNEIALADVVRTLKSFSLVQLNADNLSIHPLVQSVLLHSLEKEGRLRWADIAVMLAGWIFPADTADIRNWTVCSKALPHVLTVSKYPEAMEAQPYLTVGMLNEAGSNCRKTGEVPSSILIRAKNPPF